MNHDRALVLGCKRGGERGWMDGGAKVCQVEDGLTSAPEISYMRQTDCRPIDEARL